MKKKKKNNSRTMQYANMRVSEKKVSCFAWMVNGERYKHQHTPSNTLAHSHKHTDKSTHTNILNPEGLKRCYRFKNVYGKSNVTRSCTSFLGIYKPWMVNGKKRGKKFSRFIFHSLCSSIQKFLSTHTDTHTWISLLNFNHNFIPYLSYNITSLCFWNSKCDSIIYSTFTGTEVI